MKNKDDFLELFGEIEEELIYQADQPWDRKKIHFSFGYEWKKIACGVAICLLILAGIFHVEVKAAFEKFVTGIQELFEFDADVSGSIGTVGTSIKKNGITVTVNEILAGKHELRISYVIDPPFPTEEQADADVWMKEVWVNGKSLKQGYSMSFPDPKEKGDSVRNIHVKSWIFEEEVQEGEELSGKIIFQQEEHRGSGIYKTTPKIYATYEFKFDHLRSEAAENTVELGLDIPVIIEDKISLRITKFTLNDFESAIFVDCGDAEAIRDCRFLGKDDKGKVVEYTYSHGEDGGYVFLHDPIDGRCPKEVKYLDLKLRMVESSPGDSVMYDDWDFDPKNSDGKEYASKKFRINIK